MDSPLDTASTLIDFDSDSSTVAEAWASSPLGDPDDEFAGGADGESAAPEPAIEERRPFVDHVLIAGAVAFGVAACAALGLMFFDFSPDTSVVQVPGHTSPQPAVVITPGGQTPSTVAHAPAPRQPAADVGTPPAPAGAPVVADVLEPAPAPEPQGNPQTPAPKPQDDPQDPDPQPPKPPLIVDDFKPQPQPDPDPPVSQPDFPLTQAPKPAPEPDPGPPIFVPPLKAAP